MGVPFIPGAPAFGFTPVQAAFGTVLTGLIPPWPGNGGAPVLYTTPDGVAAPWKTQPYSHLTALTYTTGTTAHAVYVMRPLNWTMIKTALAKNTTAIVVDKDPGLFSTSYRYPLPGQQTAPVQVADNAIAANDYVAFQYDDGTWQLDTIASGTFAGANLVLTTGTANRNGATVRANSPLFWFGIKTDSNPQTGRVHENFLTIASTNKSKLIDDLIGSGIPTLNPGDPLIVLSNNATATGVIDYVGGVYLKY